MGPEAGNSVDRVDFCVTTMNRPQALERLLFSVASQYPEADVHVADQSENFDPAHYERLAERLQAAGLRESPTVHRLPFDCGVSVARNHLVDSTGREYKLTLDDDFMFTEQTDIDALVRLLDGSPEAGMVGGAVTRKGRVRHVGARWERKGGSVTELPCDTPFEERDGVRFRQVDFLPLFTLMRQGLFEHMRWDPELKTGGGPHTDFFLVLPKTPYNALFTPDVAIDHPPTEIDQGYWRLRTRPEFLGRTMAKHGLTRFKSIDGPIFELHSDGSDGYVVAYCELG